MNLLDYALRYVLEVEGGLSMDPEDPGNWTGGKKNHGLLKGTKYGISAASYPNLDIKNLTWDDAMAIYERDYWNPVGAEAMEPRMALAAFDFAIHSGVGTAKRYLDQVIRAGGDVHDYLDARYDFIMSLGRNDYELGWVRRLRKLERALRNLPDDMYEKVELIRIHQGRHIKDYWPESTSFGTTINGGRKLMARVPPTWWQRLFGGE